MAEKIASGSGASAELKRIMLRILEGGANRNAIHAIRNENFMFVIISKRRR